MRSLRRRRLGYGLGLAMGTKLANPDKLCINFWGDAAIGFTGMDFETAVRNQIPIMSVLSNNFSMAIELPVMPVSTERYRATDISGNYADFATALGGYGERITSPAEIVPAIKRGIAMTHEGTPILLDFITQKETRRHFPLVHASDPGCAFVPDFGVYRTRQMGRAASVLAGSRRTPPGIYEYVREPIRPPAGK